jgi:hypothetical protein
MLPYGSFTRCTPLLIACRLPLNLNRQHHATLLQASGTPILEKKKSSKPTYFQSQWSYHIRSVKILEHFSLGVQKL